MPSLEQPPEARETPKWASPITKPKLLVVEGADDNRFLAALLKSLRMGDDFDIRDLEGKGNFGEALRFLPAASGFTQINSLGIVCDADQDAQSAFLSIRNILRNTLLSVPDRPMTITAGNPRVAVFIWPNCSVSGTLETLCLSSVENDPAMPCVRQYFECLRDQMPALPKTIEKAQLHAFLLHTFLASREKPGLRIGEAAEKHYWDWDHPAFDPIKQFLGAL
jgi:hypothetical protein